MSWYRTGTIALTNGSTAVTGTGTDFLLGAAVGEGLLAPDGKVYEIASIQSSTGLTLGSGYLGATASGQSYAILPSQSYIRDLASQAATLVNSYQSVKDNVGAGKFPDGTQAAPGMRFTADEDTGIRRAGADDMRLVAGGVDQLQATAAGLTYSGGSAKTAPVDADTFVVGDSAATSVLKKLTWANMKAALLTWLQGTVLPAPGPIGSTTPGTGAFTTLAVNGADQAQVNSQLAWSTAYAMDQAALANKRATDANTYQTQTGTATFAQSASADMVRTYPTATVTLPKAYKNADYQVVIDPVSAAPALGFEGQVTVQSRSVNGFVLQMSGSATACTVRWKTLHPDAEGRVQAVAPSAQ